MQSHSSVLLWFSFFLSQHKGLCKSTLFHALNGEQTINVQCEIYESEVGLSEMVSLYVLS